MLTQCYLGSFRTTAVSGQTEDSISNRFLWNYYNRVTRVMRAIDTTDSWTIAASAVLRQANANTANQINYVQGLSEDLVTATALHSAINSTTTSRNISTDIGVDSTSVASAQIKSITSCTNSAVANINAFYRGYPGIGKHSLMWLEKGGGTDTQTFFGDNTAGGLYGQNGIFAEILA